MPSIDVLRSLESQISFGRVGRWDGKHCTLTLALTFCLWKQKQDAKYFGPENQTCILYVYLIGCCRSPETAEELCLWTGGGSRTTWTEPRQTQGQPANSTFKGTRRRNGIGNLHANYCSTLASPSKKYFLHFQILQVLKSPWSRAEVPAVHIISWRTQRRTMTLFWTLPEL